MKRTALITGASAGIGLELAKVFAAHHTDLLLVARNAEKLAQLSGQLQKDFGVNVRTLSKDLSLYGSAAEVFRFCSTNGITVDYLVNNAGIGYFGMFASGEWEKQRQIMDLNMMALTHLTHLFLQG